MRADRLAGLYPATHHLGAAVLAGITLLALVLLAGTADRTGRAGAVLLAAVSVLWILVNQPMEGPIIVELSGTHGVTTADVIGLAGLALALWRWTAAR